MCYDKFKWDFWILLLLIIVFGNKYEEDYVKVDSTSKITPQRKEWFKNSNAKVFVCVK